MRPGNTLEHHSSAPGFAARMRIYFAEMFPLPTHLLVAVGMFGSLASFVARTTGVEPALLSWRGLAGIWTVFDVFLILRLMDDLKDRDIDRVLFPARPLPSGRVRESDIRGALAAAIAAYLAVALPFGVAFWSALAVLAYLLLMFRLFFVPGLLRASLPLSVATHAPIVPLLLAHCTVLYAGTSGMSLASVRWRFVVPFVIALWTAMEAWEVGRKIRAPADETEYVTYSRLLGVRGAVSVSIVLRTVAAAVAIGLGFIVGGSAIQIVLTAVGYGLALAMDLRFVARPSYETCRCRAAAELFGALFLLAQLLGYGPV